MPDLDALIREDLNDDVLLSCSGGDHVDHTHYQATVNALRAVLDLEPPPFHPGDDPAMHELLTEGWKTCLWAAQDAIARELGVKP